MVLINADSFKKFIESLPKNPNGTSRAYSESDILHFIDAQPTAYDIDKVVAELEEWSFKTEIVIPGSDGYDDTANREIVCTKNAIDIVRKGGAE